jgi:hypothetical protein
MLNYTDCFVLNNFPNIIRTSKSRMRWVGIVALVVKGAMLTADGIIDFLAE